MAATNAYILHRRIQNENESKEKFLALPDFRETLAAGLVTYKNKNLPGRPINTKNASSPRWANQSPSSQSGRTINSPSLQTERAKQSPLSHRPFQHELKHGQKSKHPISDLRLDQLNHFSVEKDVASTAKLHKRNAYAQNAICIYAAQRIKTVL